MMFELILGQLINEDFDRVDLVYDARGNLTTTTYYRASKAFAVVTWSYDSTDRLLSLQRKRP